MGDFTILEVYPEIMQFVYGWGAVVAAVGPCGDDVCLNEVQDFLFIVAGADVSVDCRRQGL